MCGFLTRVICQTDKKSGQANAKLSHTNVSKNMPETRGADFCSVCHIFGTFRADLELFRKVEVF